jgi:beta-xylosidase
MNTSEIHIRDPFIFPDPSSRTYYLFGTTGKTAWDGRPEGFDCYKSRDLQSWEGPIAAFRPPEGFWATRHFWAPEVHQFEGRYYMFASFKADQRYRGTQILASSTVTGPYVPVTSGPITPDNWECLDGTLHVDRQGSPWIVFCHEWVQVHNGAIYAMQLSRDLKTATGRPVFLFNASEAPWVEKPDWPDSSSKQSFPRYVTDGPFLYRTTGGALLMLWSSIGNAGYAMGFARSESDNIAGPWRQEPDPLWSADGGHGMIFRAFDGRLLLTLHRPNANPGERAAFFEIEDTGDCIRLKA